MLTTQLQLCLHCIIYLLTEKIRVIIIVFFSVAPIQNGTSECPLHYNLVGDDCYFVSSIKLTWKVAREVCKREGNGDLISVHDPVGQGKIVTAQSKLYKKVAIMRIVSNSAREKPFCMATKIRSSEPFSYDYYDFCDYNHVALGGKHQQHYHNHNNAKSLLHFSQYKSRT